MTAKNPVRRNVPARVLAEQFGASERTVRRIVAEPRTEYVERARRRRQRAWDLRQAGASYKDIADDLGCPVGSVSKLLRKAAEEQSS